MALTASFYTYTGDNRVLEKELGAAIKTLTNTIKPYKPLDDLTGVLTLDYDAALLSANYCHLGTYANEAWSNDKYYYVIDRKYDIGQKMELVLKVDVLMTYKSEIMRGSINTLSRTSTSGLQNLYLPDNTWPIEQDPIILTYNLGGFTFTEQQVVANIVG